MNFFLSRVPDPFLLIEFYFYYACFCLVVPYMFKVTYDLSKSKGNSKKKKRARTLLTTTKYRIAPKLPSLCFTIIRRLDVWTSSGKVFLDLQWNDQLSNPHDRITAMHSTVNFAIIYPKLYHLSWLIYSLTKPVVNSSGSAHKFASPY
jgi:hypothetical protein